MQVFGWIPHVKVWRSWLFQFVAALFLVATVSWGCHALQPWIDYRITALLLLLCLTLCSFFMAIAPLLLLAISSGLILNFFFIPPLYTFHIENAEDSLLFFMYLVVALLHGVLSTRIRAAEARSRDKEEKEKTIRLYNTVLNSLSHEMRTPLATLIGAADTLNDRETKLEEEDQARLLEVIAEAAMRLNRQVDNLLNMSRMEAGMLRVQLDWCDLNELVLTCLEKCVPSEESSRIFFRQSVDQPYFQADAGLLEQVLSNLIHNALQYAGDKASIEVEIKETEEGFSLSVADNGSGLQPFEMDRVFEKFYRQPGNKKAGTGLGLSIAQGIAEAHGGKLCVASRRGGGLIFTLEIPSAKSHLNKLKHE